MRADHCKFTDNVRKKFYSAMLRGKGGTPIVRDMATVLGPVDVCGGNVWHRVWFERL